MMTNKVSAMLAALICCTGVCAPCAHAQQKSLSQQIRGNLSFEDVPPLDAALARQLDAYRQSRGATFLDWLPEGGLLVATRFGEVEEVHRVMAPLGAREQLTFAADPVITARAPRTGNGFVFLQAEPSAQHAQLFYYSANAPIQQLTTGKFTHGSPIFSNDGKRIAFRGTDRGAGSYDVYVADIFPAAAPRFIAGDSQGDWQPLDWSPDDRKLLLRKDVAANESALYIADVYTGSLSPVDESGHKELIRSAKFAPDGRGIYLTTDADGEFAQLRYFDPVTKDVRRLTQSIPWDIEAFDVSADGRYVAYVANEDGRSRLTVIDTVQKREQVPAGLPDGLIGAVRFDRSGHLLAFSAESAQSPRDVFVYDVSRNALERWTHSEAGALEIGKLVPAELVRYPTWDRTNGSQRMLSAYLYQPRTPGPHPVLIDLHGGPESQYRPGWDPFVQFLVNELGYAVIAPNVRGSAGYGKTFRKLDDGALREDAVKDIGALIVWIGLQPMFDREHVAVRGEGYGGFLALAALAAYGDRLKGAVDEFGISNLVTYLENTPLAQREPLRAEYGDERDAKTRAFLTRISPLGQIALIRRPVLVAARANDPRQPTGESQQIVWRLRGRGTEVWSVTVREPSDMSERRAGEKIYLQSVAMFLRKLAKN